MIRTMSRMRIRVPGLAEEALERVLRFHGAEVWIVLLRELVSLGLERCAHAASSLPLPTMVATTSGMVSSDAGASRAVMPRQRMVTRSAIFRTRGRS